MPIDIQLTAVPTPGDATLAETLAAASGEDDGSEDLAVAVQGARAALGDPVSTPYASRDGPGAGSAAGRGRQR